MTPLETCRYAGHFPELEGTAFAMPRSAGLVAPAPPLEGRVRDRIREHIEDLTGETFGLLFVEETVSDTHRGSKCRVVCTGCKRRFVYNASDLVHGLRKTCGDFWCRRRLKGRAP